MLVREVMNKNVVTANTDLDMKKAADIMSKYSIGSLVILNEKKIVGIVTERNVLNAVAEGRNCEATLVADIMTKKVITVEPDKKVEDAVKLMIDNKVKKLPVVDKGEIVGIITASDIIVVEPKLIEGIANLISMNVSGYRGG